MRRMVTAWMLSLTVVLSVPAHAATEAWTVAGGRVQVAGAGVGLPTTAGPLQLTETRTGGTGGEANDNLAQYKSPDGAIEGTVYVYKPAYADAALAAYGTDRAIMARFGSETRLEASGTVPVAGGSAIRRIYTAPLGGGFVTTAAFAKSGPWIVKLRVSARAERRAEVEQALDELIAGLSADRQIDHAANLRIEACPATVRKKARRVDAAPRIRGLENNPLAALLLRSAVAEPRNPSESIARNGSAALCVRDHLVVGNDRVPLLQRHDEPPADPSHAIAVLNDAGATIELRRTERAGRYVLLFHEIARTTDYGTFGGLLPSAQIVETLRGGSNRMEARPVSVYKIDGSITSVIEVGAH